MRVSHSRVNHMKNPVGYMFEKLVFSFVVEETQAEFIGKARLQIASDEKIIEMIYDSGFVENPDNLAWEVKNVTIEAETRYYWRVEVFTSDEKSAVSEVCWFESGKKESWDAVFITPDFDKDTNAVLFRDFSICKPVYRARIYMCGLGLYEVYLNGNQCGNEYLAPGFCDYSSKIPYQTYEIEITEGVHRIEVLLGSGWYRGTYGLKKEKEIYGTECSGIVEIHIQYVDSSSEVICSDETWKSRASHIVQDSLYDGEIINMAIACDEIRGVRLAKDLRSLLMPRINVPITVYRKLKPVAVLHTPAGEIVLDMGQIMTGWISFKDYLPEGTEIRLKMGEILQNNNFYRENLRTAKAEFCYIADGSGRLVRPHFTFCGFRYVKITGWPEDIQAEAFTGIVLSTQMNQTGEVVTSNPLINRLFLNAMWGQRCNFLDIPSDCPQRNSRMGWTGDAQMISGTAVYNFDTYSFYRKYLHDIVIEQEKAGGCVPHVAPMANHEWYGTSAAWGDAATIIPWNLYLHWGDKTILRDQYKSMSAWVGYIHSEGIKNGNPYLWKSGNHFGDWLALDAETLRGRIGKTDPYYIASVYYYISTNILACSAEVLDKKEDAEVYQCLAEQIKCSIQKEYFTVNGTLAIDTMTAHVLALHFDLIPNGAASKVAWRLKKLLQRNDYKLNTGFVGTPYLCPVLSKQKMDVLAYRLLLNEEYPGWLYEVKLGATTIWECWDSLLQDGTVNGTDMNSLNHMVYGSVAEWLYAYMIGLKPLKESPGFKRALIEPHPNRTLAWAQGSVRTAAGTYCIKWEYYGKKLKLRIDIPCNAIAQVILHDVDGMVLVKKDGDKVFESLKAENGKLSHEAKAGTYIFSYLQTEAADMWFSLESPIQELLSNPVAAEIVTEFVGDLSRIPCVEEVHSLQELIHLPFIHLTQEELDCMEQELKALKIR